MTRGELMGIEDGRVGAGGGAARPRGQAARRTALAATGLVALAVACGASAATAGCGDYGPVTLAGDAGTFGSAGRGVGEACSVAELCRPGLACVGGACAPGGSLDEGAACVISGECKQGLHCSAARRCEARGRAAVGEPCASEADCASGARCDAVGLTAECRAEGSGDLGAACSLGADCLAGLLCTDGVCAAPPASTGAAPVAVSRFAGVACADEAGPARAWFRVPRGTDDGDFFRLPFPNDVRRKDGRLDLSGFPAPGADVLGYDLVERYRAYVEANADGFSAYSSIVLRFSGDVDFESMKQPGVIRLVDLTEAADVGFGWSATSARTPYVCANAVTVRPAVGRPLAPGHTFALLVSSGARAKGGGAIEVSPDLTALLSSSDPGGALSSAWAAYAPLRAWATASAYDLGALVTGTVFTVGDPTKLVASAAATVASAPATALKGWVRCGAAPSPCPGATGERACPAADAAFDELHALLSLPVYQKGEAPFRGSPTDGDVVLDGAGSPVAQSTADVCVSLTVPKGTTPAAGFPLVVYAHDTGGHFRSHVALGLAKRLVAADAGAAAVAVLGFEQVGHGARKPAGVSEIAAALPTWSPGAMRGVGVQAAADVLGIVRAARDLSLDAASSPTSNPIRFGPIVLFGHGAGAAAVALAAPRVQAEGVVLAGHGGSFLDAVPARRRPASFFDVAPIVLGESPLSAPSPVLSLLQLAVEPVDPLVHAASLVVAPATAAKHTLMVYGQGDGFAPAATQVAYALAAGLGVAAPPASLGTPEPIVGSPLAVPAGANAAGGTVTAIVRQYSAAGGDGHDVVFRDGDAVKDVERFVADVALGVIPQVGR